MSVEGGGFIDARASAHWGGDESGLIAGFRFSREGVASPIGAAEALAALDDEATAFVWLHFNLAHTSSLRWLKAAERLPEEFFDAITDRAHATRVERTDDALVAVLHDVQFQFDFESSDTATLFVAVGERLVVSARQQPLASVDRLRAEVKRGRSFDSPVALLTRLLEAQADVLVDIVRGVTARIDGIEDDLLAGRRGHTRARLGALRRLLVRLSRQLAPEPAALFRLLQHPHAWMRAGDTEDLRQASEQFSVSLGEVSGLQERIKLLQEEIAAAVNEENNRSLFVLTVVTVLALPINILAGLFGMNVGGVPWGQNEHGFWIVVGIVTTFTAVAAWFAFIRSRPR